MIQKTKTIVICVSITINKRINDNYQSSFRWLLLFFCREVDAIPRDQTPPRTRHPPGTMHPSPWTESQTPVKHYLPATSFAGGNKRIQKWELVKNICWYWCAHCEYELVQEGHSNGSSQTDVLLTFSSKHIIQDAISLYDTLKKLYPLT